MLTDSQRRMGVGLLCLLMAAMALWLNVLDTELGNQ